MKPFKLQPVLRHREIIEESSRQALADALKKERRLRQSLGELHERLERIQTDLQSRQQCGISVQDLLLFEEGIARCGRERAALQSDLVRVEESVRQCREALAGASRDRRLLEKLKEKHHAQVRRETARRETVLLDEVALQFTREKI